MYLVVLSQLQNDHNDKQAFRFLSQRYRMAGRGGFNAIAPVDVDRFLSLGTDERWDFAASEQAALFVVCMDKAWIPIHCALSDDTLLGTLGEPPLCNAVLGDHLVCNRDNRDFVYLKYANEVGEISQELKLLSREKFAERLKCAEFVNDEDVASLGLSFLLSEMEYAWSYFCEMRVFYATAAERELAVLFRFGV